jgi:hypothetical protein
VHLGFEGAVGMGSPGGLLALGVVLHRWDIGSIAAGAGVGWDGGQLYANVRLQPLAVGAKDKVRPGLSLGWSNGRYATGLTSNNVPYYWHSAHWLNTELYLAARTGTGFEARMFAGVGVIANPNAVVCEGGLRTYSDCKPPKLWMLPSIGASGSFDLF